MKNAFTLIELLLSLVLTIMMVYFTYTLLADSKVKSEWNTEVDARYFEKSEKIKLLYDDIFLSQSYKIEGGKNYSILRLKTLNSVHNISAPYVVWLVLKESNELVRLESRDEIPLPMSDFVANNTFMDEISKDCVVFKAYESTGKTDIMIFIELKGQKPIVFEVPKKIN